MSSMLVPSYPYSFPLHGGLAPRSTAIIVIDMQADFCAPGGYMDCLGFDLDVLRAPIEPIRRVLAAARPLGFTVVHTRETFAADLSNVQPHRLWRGAGLMTVGDRGPLGRCLIEGEPCWEIIPELAPAPGEPVVDKAAYGAFCGTDLDGMLKERGILNLILMGLTTDCCIHTTLREALDRGFDCLTLEDCCGAATRETNAAALALLKKKAGIFGATATSDQLLEALAGREAAQLPASILPAMAR